MVIGHGQRHQLVQAEGVGAVVGHQAWGDVGQLEAALHHQRRDAEVGRDVFHRAPFGHQGGEGFELVGRVHGLALHVLGQAGGARAAVGHQQAGHVPILGDAALLGQQLEGREAATSGHHLVVSAVRSQGDSEVLQQAHALDAGGQRFDGRARGLAHVAARRAQPRQRHEQHLLRGLGGHLRCGDGVQGLGFGIGECVHGETPVG
ncbi:hypothetical protein A8M77_06575 [Variovorax sp. JS1663]|nr:hypothetical protein A8M77_06575 [Variovorax sp. JS1663]